MKDKYNNLIKDLKSLRYSYVFYLFGLKLYHSLDIPILLIIIINKRKALIYLDPYEVYFLINPNPIIYLLIQST